MSTRLNKTEPELQSFDSCCREILEPLVILDFTEVEQRIMCYSLDTSTNS